MKVEGLPFDETDIAARLIEDVKAKQPRNELRSSLMDHKRILDHMSWGLQIPTNLQAVLGWPAKAVETLARRCRLESFTVIGSEPAAFGIDEVLDGSQFLRRARQGELSSLVHGVSFEVASRGIEGEPDVLVTHTSALNGTGDWDDRLGRLTSFVSVSEWSKTGEATAFTLHLPGVMWTVANEWAEKSDHAIRDRIPVEPLVYKPRLDRPFGASRISRPVIFLTQSAARVVVRSEATADLYSAPSLIALGLTSEQVAQGTWRQGIGNVVGIPDADEGPEGAPNLARVAIEKIQQASQEPHIAQLRAWAQLFAGETSIPVSSLGISIDSNPTSAESYAASREDLISEAEDASGEWGAAHRRTLLNALALREGVGVDELPAELAGLRARWRDPRHTSQASAADSLVKLVGAVPALAGSDSLLDMLGLDPELSARLKSDLVRGRAGASIAALAGLSDGLVR